MIAIGAQYGWRRGEQCVVAVMWALPMYEFLNPWLTLPQIGPAVTATALLVLLRRARALPRSPARR